MLLGLSYLIIIVVAAQFLRSAPDGFVPSGWTPPAPAQPGAGGHLTLAEALRTRCWYLLWGMLALNVAAGAALISVASPLAQEFAGVGPAIGAMVVCMISLFNGAGRLFWGACSDRIGRATTFLALFMLQTSAFAVLSGSDTLAMLLLPVAIIALCYGGGFGTMPAFTADMFGARNAGTIYGVMLTAWSAGAVVGPILIASVPYRTALLLVAGLLLAAAALPLSFSSHPRRIDLTVSAG
jgi:OFA family oxalate/formate antiporter-like MFS transporter